MNIGEISANLNNFKAENLLKKSSESKFEDTLKQLTVENQDDKALRKVCMDFEAIFLRMMYRQMRNSIPKSGFMPESSATEIYEDMYDEKLVDEVVKGRGIGLGETLYKAMKRQTGLAQNDSKEVL